MDRLEHEYCGSLVPYSNKSEILALGPYREVVKKALAYFRFLGFSRDLNAESLQAAVERCNQAFGHRGETWEQETGTVDFAGRRFGQLINRMVGSPRNQPLQEEERRRLASQTLDDYIQEHLPDEESREYLQVLDRLVKDFDRLPNHEEFLAWAKKKRLPEYLVF